MTQGNNTRVVSACEKVWDANKADCSAFAKAVAAELKVPLPNENADGLVEYLRNDKNYRRLGDGSEAKSAAMDGEFVLAGLKGADNVPPQKNGHIVVVTGPDLAMDKYPTAYWGKLGGVGEKSKTLNYAWNAASRDKVEYFARKL